MLFLFSAILLTPAFKVNVKNPADKYISVAKLLKENKISIDIKGTGGYQENCLKFEIKNLTKDTLNILIEQGRRFVSNDSGIQDILLVKKQELTSPPESKIIQTGYGFCCEASMKSPQVNSLFNIGYLVPEQWNKVLDLINQFEFETHSIQSAVWVLSDNHSLASVYAENQEKTQNLRHILAKVKGIEIPWYSVSYQQDTSMVFSDKHLKVWGSFDYHIKHNSIISINVRSKNGQVMKTLVKEMLINPGDYIYKLDLKVSNWPKGEYEINVFEDEAILILKKSFKL